MLEVFGFPIGTIAQLGTLGIVLVAVIGAYVKLRDRGMTHAEVMCGQLTNEVASLRGELHKCEEECRKDIKALHEELFGMRKNHIAEQLAFINILLRSVDSPELSVLRSTLERVQDSLAKTQKLQQLKEEKPDGAD